MRALICGISGQDGAYLAQLLLGKGYTVVGTSRDAQTSSFSGLKRLGIFNDVQFESMATHDFRSVLHVLRRVDPDEIYNLAGQASATETPAQAGQSRRRPSNHAVPMPLPKRRRSGW
jgi:GDPmannose 4,6-dehydratase